MHREGPAALGPKVIIKMCLIREFIKSLRFIPRPSLSHCPPTLEMCLWTVCVCLYRYTINLSPCATHTAACTSNFLPTKEGSGNQTRIGLCKFILSLHFAYYLHFYILPYLFVYVPARHPSQHLFNDVFLFWCSTPR